MPRPAPELLFLAGPREGQRAVLLKTVSVAGRSEDCDVHLAEEFVSRQHLRFQITPDGCQVEILSPRGVRINGKTYKPPKAVLLDTGDRLCLGAATELLFVAAGDDPAEALASYRKEHPLPRPARPPKAPPPPASQPPRKEEPKTAPLTPAQEEQARRETQRRSKLRKYAVLGGVYAAVMVGLFFFVSNLKKKETVTTGPPPLVPDSLIEEAVREPLSRGINGNIAAEQLRTAQALFDGRRDRRGNLQKCVKAFKLHLAYLHKPDFDDPDNSSQYQAGRDELAEKVKAVYKEAWLRERARRWRDANLKWQELREILPDDPEWNTPKYKEVVDNVMFHAAYARSNITRQR